MVPLLDSRDVVYVSFIPGLTVHLYGCRNMNKVRVVALYIQHREGVPEEDRRRLYQHARLTLAEQDAVNALAHMGVRLSRVRQKKAPMFGYLIFFSFRDLTTETQRRS